MHWNWGVASLIFPGTAFGHALDFKIQTGVLRHTLKHKFCRHHIDCLKGACTM